MISISISIRCMRILSSTQEIFHFISLLQCLVNLLCINFPQCNKYLFICLFILRSILVALLVHPCLYFAWHIPLDGPKPFLWNCWYMRVDYQSPRHILVDTLLNSNGSLRVFLLIYRILLRMSWRILL